MSINNPLGENSENKIKLLIKDLNANEIKEVIDFIKDKDRKIKKAQRKRSSLQGVISDSSVTDEDIEMVKKIWK